MGLTRRGVVFLLTAAVIVLIVLFQLGWLAFLADGVAYVTRPIERTFFNISRQTNSFFSTLGSISDLHRQNQELQAEAAGLLAENAKLKELAQENTELRQALDFKEKHNYTTVPGRIIGHDPEALSSC